MVGRTWRLIIFPLEWCRIREARDGDETVTCPSNKIAISVKSVGYFLHATQEEDMLETQVLLTARRDASDILLWGSLLFFLLSLCSAWLRTAESGKLRCCGCGA